MSHPAHLFGLAILSVALFPSLTFAADTASGAAPLAAGFAATPVWVSQANPVAGDALKLFAVVKNSATTTVTGVVLFAVDGATVGSVKISLAAGTAQVLSAPWNAAIGSHSITATFSQATDANQQSVSLSETVAGPLTVAVSAAPPKALALQIIETATTAAVPAVSGVFQTTENIRKQGLDYFAAQLGLDATGTPVVAAVAAAQGQVLGASTENIASTAPAAAAASPNDSFINRLGYSIFQNPWLFYPAILVALCVAIWLALAILTPM